MNKTIKRAPAKPSEQSLTWDEMVNEEGIYRRESDTGKEPDLFVSDGMGDALLVGGGEVFTAMKECGKFVPYHTTVTITFEN